MAYVDLFNTIQIVATTVNIFGCNGWIGFNKACLHFLALKVERFVSWSDSGAY